MRLAYIAGHIFVALIFFSFTGNVYAHSTHQLIEEIQETYDLEYAYLHRVLSEAQERKMRRSMPDACKRMVEDIADKKEDSRFALTSSTSLEMGAAYYTAHRDTFKHAEETYGIPSEYLLAFARVETYFGACLGEYNLLSRLRHIYVNAPTDKKRAFARREIGALLVLSTKNNWDPHSFFGSRWGAFGLTQFLPSSIPKFAVDGDGDGNINLFSLDDAIPSTARFLKQKGWDTDKNKAIWKYNPSRRYVYLIKEYAEKIRSYIRE